MFEQCRICGAYFELPANRRRGRYPIYCSDNCRRTKKRSYSPAQISLCSEAKCGGWVKAKGLCSTHYQQRYKRERGWSTGRAESRRRRLRTRTAWRRATRTDPDADKIDRDEIGDRDGWCCGICNETVDPDLPYPDPESPSVDHIQPLSLGGKHVESNVQIAHLRCNIAKSNRVDAHRPDATSGHISATEGASNARTSAETSGSSQAA